MAYQQEERETVVRYDEQDNAWYIETNVRRHISKFLKMAKAFEELHEERSLGELFLFVPNFQILTIFQ